MKTFKLNSLSVLEKTDEVIKEHAIDLMDGLIINREDEEGKWLIEAFCDIKYKDLFLRLKECAEKVMIHVKITKESNAPVVFLTTVVDINEIGNTMNVLFMGTMIDKDKRIAEELLSSLIADGYQGEELLEQFKKLM